MLNESRYAFQGERTSSEVKVEKPAALFTPARNINIHCFDIALRGRNGVLNIVRRRRIAVVRFLSLSDLRCALRFCILYLMIEASRREMRYRANVEIELAERTANSKANITIMFGLACCNTVVTE